MDDIRAKWRPSIHEAPFQLPVVINHHFVAWVKNNHFTVSYCFCGSEIWKDSAEQFWPGLYLNNDQRSWGLTGISLFSYQLRISPHVLSMWTAHGFLTICCSQGSKSKVLSKLGGSSNNLKIFLLTKKTQILTDPFHYSLPNSQD